MMASMMERPGRRRQSALLSSYTQKQLKMMVMLWIDVSAEFQIFGPSVLSSLLGRK
jgi:hypothetical protein